MAERDEEDVMEALAVLCDGVAVRRLRPISSGVRFNRTYINFRMSPDTTGSDRRSREDAVLYSSRMVDRFDIRVWTECQTSFMSQSSKNSRGRN